MKFYEVCGHRFEAPRYVIRVRNSWVLRVPGQAQRSFGDRRFGGAQAAFEAAEAAALSALGDRAQSFRDPALSERNSKLRPTGLAGIFIQVERRHRRTKTGTLEASPRIEYRLRVTGIGRRVKILYLGTEATWEAKLPHVLERAKAVRLELLDSA